jgi:NADPH:quinone reductase-like Zn-dependent oxidoreductase
MKALFLTGYGLQITKKLKFLDKELSPLGPDEVLVEVYAAGLNPVDYKIIYGMARIINRPAKPFALGFDLSGIVIAKGENVKDILVGDEVYSKVPWHQMGTLVTQINVQANMVALKPKNISFNEAAGFPLVGCTVVDSFKVAEVKKGTSILIIGGSGGIGTFAIQYAKYLGAKVIALTSSKNVELVTSLGADKVIAYNEVDFRETVKNVDVVFDTVGGNYPSRSIRVVKRGGKIITIAGHHDDATLKKVGVAKLFRILFQIKGSLLMLRIKRKDVYYKHVWSYPNQESLNYITKLIEAGEIRPVIDRVFRFEEAINALRYLQSKRAKGKVVVSIKS